jgi:hypothetical protein
MSNENSFNQPPVNYFPYPPQAPVAYRLNIGKLFGDVWNLYKQNFGKMVVISLIIIGISISFGILTPVVRFVLEKQEELRYVAVAFSFFNALVGNILGIWLYLGALQFILSIARGYEPRYSMLFPSIGKFLKGFGAAVMMGIIIYIPILLGIGIMAVAWFLWGNSDDSRMVLVIISVLLGLVSTVCVVYVSIRLTLAFPFIADRNDGVLASLNNSWTATRGNVLSLFAGFFVLGLCAVSGILLGGVGIILTYAVTPTGMVLAYLQITGQPNICDYQRNTQPPPMPPLYH